MIQVESTLPVPLQTDQSGVVRVTGTRVTLESILREFQLGATAEQIQESFPSITLAQIYGAIAYYLNHSEDVEQYLRERETLGEAQRQQWNAHSPSAALQARLRAVKNGRKS
jgi:uncharacterized protein (DUF433 family)